MMKSKKENAPKTAPLPMLEALQNLQCDSRLKSAAYNFLKADITKLRSEADFTQAYSGLSSSVQLLGPLSSNYVKTLSEIRKMLDVSIKRRLLPAIKLEEVSAEVESCWWDVCGVFKEYVPAAVWAELEERTRELFTNVREKLR
jgi:hypothetical protein